MYTVLIFRKPPIPNGTKTILRGKIQSFFPTFLPNCLVFLATWSFRNKMRHLRQSYQFIVGSEKSVNNFYCSQKCFEFKTLNFRRTQITSRISTEFIKSKVVILRTLTSQMHVYCTRLFDFLIRNYRLNCSSGIIFDSLELKRLTYLHSTFK